MRETVDKSYLKQIGSAIFITMTLTASAISYFFDKYVVPMSTMQSKMETTQALENEKKAELANDALSKELKELKTSLSIEIVDLKKSVSDYQEREADYQEKINTLEAGNIIYEESAYPIGFARLRVGDSIEKIKETYPNQPIEWSNENEGIYSANIKTGNSIFPNASYTYSSKTRKILLISFDGNYALEDDFLLSKISNILGEPTPSKPKGMYLWKINKQVDAYLMSAGQYMLVSGTVAPAVWKASQEEIP
jgi:hypothetical protein